MTVLITFIQKAIMQGVCMLFGADGEILTEKSGNLNLGVPGMMYMGGIAGLIAAFYYEKAAAHPNGLVGMILSIYRYKDVYPKKIRASQIVLQKKFTINM